jgi:hypothetical protein
MVEFLKACPYDLFVWMALVLVTAWAAYFIGKIRAKTLQHELTASELISKFRELHGQGVLTDAEFRTIKTILAAELQKQVKDTGHTG